MWAFRVLCKHPGYAAFFHAAKHKFRLYFLSEGANLLALAENNTINGGTGTGILGQFQNGGQLSYSRLTKEFFSGYSVLAQLAWQARAKLVWKYRFLVFRCRLRLRNSSTTGGGSG
jgi:hypothetical protein